jgi:hypothetical protein
MPPIPGTDTFNDVNVRTYLHHDGKPGLDHRFDNRSHNPNTGHYQREDAHNASAHAGVTDTNLPGGTQGLDLPARELRLYQSDDPLPDIEQVTARLSCRKRGAAGSRRQQCQHFLLLLVPLPH